MECEVIAKKETIDFFPDTEEKEIIQNVNTILTTQKGSVPLDREFGLSQEYIDLPIATAKAKYIAEIIDQLEKYEPRCKVISVDFEEDNMDGKLIPKVKVSIVELE